MPSLPPPSTRPGPPSAVTPPVPAGSCDPPPAGHHAADQSEAAPASGPATAPAPPQPASGLLGLPIVIVGFILLGIVQGGRKPLWQPPGRSPPCAADSPVMDTTELGARDEGELMCFPVLAPGARSKTWSGSCADTALRTLPRHVPDRFYLIDAVPRTLSGKKLEVPVKKILAGVDPDKASAKTPRKILKRSHPSSTCAGATNQTRGRRPRHDKNQWSPSRQRHCNPGPTPPGAAGQEMAPGAARARSRRKSSKPRVAGGRNLTAACVRTGTHERVSTRSC